ncbi:MAG: NAD(P)-dependent oxidoreductase [Pseudomonadota bacterium]
MAKPVILFDPHPRTEEMVYTKDCAAALAELGEVEAHFGSRMPDERVEALLPHVHLVIGQTDMDRDRLDRAVNLKGIINVEANWRPNVDYAHAQSLGIPVLSAAPCMAPAVAEYCLAQAINLLRGFTLGDWKFRTGQEAYGVSGNRAARSLFGAKPVLIGYGNLGRALVPLLRPFCDDIAVHDPWLSDGYLTAQGVQPVDLDTALISADVLFILAGGTSENEGFLDADKLALIPDDAAVVLASRAEVVDFGALLTHAGRLRLAVDVFPEEPVPADDPIRQAPPGVLLTAHLAGGLHASYARIREAMVNDARQVLQGKPPLQLQRAEPRLAAISNSR